MNTNQYYIHVCCRPIPMLQTAISFIRLRVGHKKCPTFIRTPVSQAAIESSKQGGLYRQNTTVAAWNVVYEHFIYHSIRTLAWFCLWPFISPRWARKIHWKFIRFWLRRGIFVRILFRFLIILRIRDACGSTAHVLWKERSGKPDGVPAFLWMIIFLRLLRRPAVYV